MTTTVPRYADTLVTIPKSLQELSYNRRLYLLRLFHELDSVQDFSLARLFNFARQHELVKNAIDLVKVKDNIELTDIGKVTVQQLDKQVNRFQVAQFILRHIHGNGKEQASIPPINELVIVVFNKIRVFLVAGRHQAMDFGFDANLFEFHAVAAAVGIVIGWLDIPLRQTSLALAILQ